jgi:hypothetical protein
MDQSALQSFRGLSPAEQPGRSLHECHPHDLRVSVVAALAMTLAYVGGVCVWLVVVVEGLTAEEAKAKILKDRPGLDVVFQVEVSVQLRQ